MRMRLQQKKHKHRNQLRKEHIDQERLHAQAEAQAEADASEAIDTDGSKKKARVVKSTAAKHSDVEWWWQEQDQIMSCLFCYCWQPSQLVDKKPLSFLKIELVKNDMRYLNVTAMCWSISDDSRVWYQDSNVLFY